MGRQIGFAITLGLINFAPAAAQETSNELVEMVVGFLSDDDRDVRALALEQIRSAAPGEKATKRFAAQLPNLSTEAKVGLLSALADRADIAAKPTVLRSLASEDVEVTIAAIRALGKLGDVSDTEKLISLSASDNESVRNVARESLVQLRGDGVSRAIVRGMGRMPATDQVGLIKILQVRRAIDTIPNLLLLARGRDATLRMAAMDALGQLAGPDQIPGMVKAVLRASKGNERNQAERNLMLVCRRIGEPNRQAAPLLAVMRELNTADRTAMMPALGRVGGSLAWEEVEKAIASRDAAVHLAGVRAISNWPDSSAAKRLKEIAGNDPHPDHRRIARMSLLRIAPLPDGRSDQEKLALLKEAMQLAANEKERNYRLKRAAAIRLVDTLRFVLPYIDQPAHAQEACQSVIELAHDRGLRDSYKDEFHAALDKVIATTNDAVLTDRANRYKKGQTWVRP